MNLKQGSILISGADSLKILGRVFLTNHIAMFYMYIPGQISKFFGELKEQLISLGRTRDWNTWHQIPAN